MKDCKHKIAKAYLKQLLIYKTDKFRYGVKCTECDGWVYDKKEQKYKIPKDLNKIQQIKMHYQGTHTFELLNHAIEDYHRKFSLKR